MSVIETLLRITGLRVDATPSHVVNFDKSRRRLESAERDDPFDEMIENMAVAKSKRRSSAAKEK